MVDVCRWCTEDGKRFGKTMEDVAPSIPPDWKVTQSWHTISTESDPDGWQYSITFDSPFWYAISDNGACKHIDITLSITLSVILIICIMIRCGTTTCMATRSKICRRRNIKK